MPFGDGTGPEGRGSFSGRGMGYCAGNDRPGCYEPGYGRGRGMGRGRFGGGGFGRRPRFGGWQQTGFYQEAEPPHYENNNIEMLKQQQSWLQTQLENISRKLEELSAKKEK